MAIFRGSFDTFSFFPNLFPLFDQSFFFLETLFHFSWSSFFLSQISWFQEISWKVASLTGAAPGCLVRGGRMLWCRPKIKFLFSGATFHIPLTKSATLNRLLHCSLWQFSGALFYFRGLFFTFRGRNCPEPPCNFSPALMLHRQSWKRGGGGTPTHFFLTYKNLWQAHLMSAWHSNN